MKKIILILLIFTSIHTNAQILRESIIADTFNTIKEDVFNSIELRNNSIFIWNSLNPINGYADSFAINIYTKNGINQSYKSYPMLGLRGKIADVEQMKNGNIALAIETQTNSSLIITDSIGNYISHKTYARPDTNIHIVEIAIDNNNNVLILSQKLIGYNYFICNVLHGNMYMIFLYTTYITKLDANGNLFWNKIISEDTIKNTVNSAYFANIAFDKTFNSDNSFNLIKYQSHSIDSLAKIKLENYNTNGTLVWNKTLTINSSINSDECIEELGFYISNEKYIVYENEYIYYYNKLGNLLDIHPKDIVDYENCIYNTSNNSFNLSGNTDELYTKPILKNNKTYFSGFDLQSINNGVFFNISLKSNDWKLDIEDGISYRPICIGIYPYNDSTLLFINTRKFYDGDPNLYKTDGHLVFHTVTINDNQINYSAYKDFNNNEVFDVTDTIFTDGFVQTTYNNQIENNALSDSGKYVHFAKNGTTVSKLVNHNQAINYYTIYASHDTTIFNGSIKFDTIIFRLVPIPNIQDLEVYITPTTPARPGFAASYIVHAKNIGTKTIHNINVKFLKDTHQNIIDNTLFTIVNDTVIWSIDSLTINQSINYTINCLNDTALTTADTLHLFAAITPFENDTFVLDNTFILNQNVVNSFDPNDKLEAHGAGISPQQFSDGDYLYYTIRFQNTGNSYATKIKIVDTLSTHLDWSTLELLSSSHTFSFNVQNNNVLTWLNDNLYLPNSTTDEAGSHGYVSFRIKPKQDFTINDNIQNRAHIYFDYNAPVITNTTSTVILQERTTSIKQNNTIQKIKLFPSPTNGNMQLQFDITNNKDISLQITDINGKIMQQQNLQPNVGFNSINVDLSAYTNGIYFIQLYTDNEQLYYGKVLKQ